jgi:hypothetical protein
MSHRPDKHISRGLVEWYNTWLTPKRRGFDSFIPYQWGISVPDSTSDFQSGRSGFDSPMPYQLRKIVEYSEQVKTIKKTLHTVETKEEYGTVLWMYAIDLSYDRGAICQAIKEWERENEKQGVHIN